MLKIGIILGSTRPAGNGRAIAAWAYERAQERGDAHFELLDLAAFDLPLLDEPVPAMLLDLEQREFALQYGQEHTRAWSAAVAACDGYVFVTPEYNHSTSGALKNAIDFLFHEWTDKAAGFIGYGSTPGFRAIENLRLIMAAVQVATVRPQVGLSLFTDFENSRDFRPGPLQEARLGVMLDHVVAWSGAMRVLRATVTADAG